MNKNLIIRAELVNPPSQAASFRDVTMYPTLLYETDVLIEVEPDFVDIYYHWMKRRGLLDFVRQFVKPFEEVGLAVDFDKRQRQTILVARIVPENLISVLGELRGRFA